jgi:carbon storage regulator CsrA
MLILSAKPGEKFKIGDIIIEIVAIRNLGKMRLGINAPREINVQRVTNSDLRKKQKFNPVVDRRKLHKRSS